MAQQGSVLVVDDELGPRESLRMILQPLYEVKTASNGQEALQFLQEGKIDLITLDLKMPGLSGLDVLREIKKMKYSGEGWGLTSDGKYLLMSNGSSTVTFRDPESFKTVREIQVRDGDNPVGNLNELEFIKGEIWANIYMEDVIVRISPKNGKVTGWIDLSELRSYLARNTRVDVINGIAYDGKSNRIFLTGKYWPKIFEIQIKDKN